jgi:hypothetical protein
LNADARRVLSAGFAVILVLVLTACHVKIQDLERNPGKFQGKEVTVSGNVTDSFGLLGNGAYQVNDGTGSIWIISEGMGVPSRGAHVSVTGTVIQGASVGGRALGMALRQTRHTGGD